MPNFTQFEFKTVAGQQIPFTQEVITTAFQPQQPFPQNPSAIVYRARIMQLRAYYTRPAANTPHPNLPQVYFADDGDFSDETSGLISWTRTWVTLPNSWFDYTSYAYTYPGYISVRVPYTRTVTAKMALDYFIVGTLPTFSAGVLATDDFSNAAWTKTASSATANASNVPFCAGGALAAAKLSESNTSAEHLVSQSSNVASGQVWGAVFMRAAERTQALVRLSDGGVIANVAVDLETGNMRQPTGNWGTIAAVGEGWFRIGLSGVAANANTALQVVIVNNNTTSYLGDGASGLYLWRGQVAAGGTLPHATVAPTLTADNTNYPINAAGDIPSKFGIQYLYAWTANIAAEYLSAATTPTLANYQANVTGDANVAGNYSIEATDSELKIYQGSIWWRNRTFVKAR